jgi:cytochrome c-type biogenesis protein CcmH/NrfF
VKKFLQLVCVGLVIVVSAGAGDPTARFDKLSHQIMCGCSCNQLLGECNHVGCPDSPGMRDKLMSEVSHGEDDHAILVDFQNDYGPAVLAAPRFTAFNHLAWIMPPLVLALGLLIVAFTVRRWRLQPASIPAAPTDYSKSEFDAVRDRIRHDTEI